MNETEAHAPVAVKALRGIDAVLADSADDARRAAVKFRLANFLAWGTGDPRIDGNPEHSIDTISPPDGVWTALNQIPGPKEPLPMIESEHDNLTPQKGRACPARTREILDLLVKGGEFHPNGIRQLN